MRLHAVTLLVPSYDEGLAFYAAGLGFRVLADEPQGDKRWVVVEPPGGGSALLLAVPTGEDCAALGRQAGGRVAFFLACDDFEAAHARLLAAGAVFEEAARREPYGTVAVWRDPFGNRWDLLGP